MTEGKFFENVRKDAMPQISQCSRVDIKLFIDHEIHAFNLYTPT